MSRIMWWILIVVNVAIMAMMAGTWRVSSVVYTPKPQPNRERRTITFDELREKFNYGRKGVRLGAFYN